MPPIFNPYPPISQLKQFETDEPLLESETTLTSDQKTIPSVSRLLALVALTGLAILFRLFDLQIAKGSSNFFLAEGNRIRQLLLPAPRGVIYDHDYQPLVKNIVQYSLAVIPVDLPRDRTARHQLLDQISNRLNDQAKQKLQSLAGPQKLLSAEPVEIASLSVEEAINWQIELVDTPGVMVLKQPQRQYQPLVSLGHILGYIGKIDEKTLHGNPGYHATDWIGKTGLEQLYESTLAGLAGAQQFEVNAKGELQRLLAVNPPRQGSNLRLSLDSRLQKTTGVALGAIGPSVKAAAIAINPQTGQILSLVSLPDFDSNVFVSGDDQSINRLLVDPNQPLVNRAISGQYPSGSTIKPIWAAAALQEKVVSPNLTIDTPPEITIGQFTFPDWKDHGATNIRRAIAESNNIFFYALAGGWGPIKGLGIERMEKYLKMFNFGEKTGLDLTSESAGFVPSPEWKKQKTSERWYIGDTYHLGIGQGDISVTPLQLLVAESAMFNGGKIFKPYLVEAITDNNGQEVKKAEPTISRTVPIDDQSRQVVKEGMRLAVADGSARSLADVQDRNGRTVEIAAKTGTAQFGSEGQTHAWLVGFAPWNDPEIGVIVLVEGGGEGHAVAAPVAKKMFEDWFNR